MSAEKTHHFPLLESQIRFRTASSRLTLPQPTHSLDINSQTSREAQSRERDK